MAKIHYIGNYVHGSNDRNLFGFPSAISKMNYIISALKRAHHKVIVFSTGETQNRFFCYYPNKIVIIDEQEQIVYSNTFGTPFYLFKIFSRIWIWIQMVHYFLFKIKSNDILLVYHSPLYKIPIKIATFFKKINLYIEVDEIYNATLYRSDKEIEQEISYLQIAKGYLFVNDLMNKLFNNDNKPVIICYGDYRNSKIAKKYQNSNKIRLVYAGLIGDEDSDVCLAIKTMSYLSDDYQLDIAGYGSDKDIRHLIVAIEKTNVFLKRTAIYFHGLLQGDTYLSFLSECNIGLCTRILPDNLSNYTFPSKVLVYLGCDLIPLCSSLSCIKQSKIYDNVVFCEEVNPKSVAKAIQTIDFNRIKKTNILETLDDQFVLDLKDFFINSSSVYE